jgi:hypothetical protein
MRRIIKDYQNGFRVEDFNVPSIEVSLEKSGGSEDLKTWLSWARTMADKYDPLSNDYKPFFES